MGNLSVEKRLKLTQEYYDSISEKEIKIEGYKTVFTGRELERIVLEGNQGYTSILQKSAGRLLIATDSSLAYAIARDNSLIKAIFKDNSGYGITAKNKSLGGVRAYNNTLIRTEFHDKSGFGIHATDSSLLFVKAYDNSLEGAVFEYIAGGGMYITGNSLQNATFKGASGKKVQIELYPGTQPLLGANVSSGALMYPLVIIPDENYEIPDYLLELIEGKEPEILVRSKESRYIDARIREINYNL